MSKNIETEESDVKTSDSFRFLAVKILDFLEKKDDVRFFFKKKDRKTVWNWENGYFSRKAFLSSDTSGLKTVSVSVAERFFEGGTAVGIGVATGFSWGFRRRNEPTHKSRQ